MTLAQLITTLNTSFPGKQWVINSADKDNVLYSEFTWLDTGSAPTSSELGF